MLSSMLIDKGNYLPKNGVAALLNFASNQLTERQVQIYAQQYCHVHLKLHNLWDRNHRDFDVGYPSPFQREN